MELFIIKSKDGKFYEKGGSIDFVWTDKPERAKIYRTIGPAKAVMGYWEDNDEIYLIKLQIKDFEIVPYDFKKAREKKLKRKRAETIRIKDYYIKSKWGDVAHLTTQIEDIEKQIKRLRNS